MHIVCQDRRPEQHDFVAAAYQYEPDGTRQMLFERTTSYTGRAILHRPPTGPAAGLFTPCRGREVDGVDPRPAG